MKALDPARLILLAWRAVPRLPRGLTRGVFEVVALVAHTLRIDGVKQLERNLARLTGISSAAELRRLSRTGMRSYMRYYCEVFQLPGMSEAEVDARVRSTGYEQYTERVSQGGTAVLALGHSGNWDLAGAWASRHIGTVITVAERLEPPELFDAFMGFRESLGMIIVPFQKGGGVFRQLLKEARRPGVVPLLADRDLSSTGVDVLIDGHEVRVAPGPAALALARGIPVMPVLIHYERLTGARRRAARSPWGIHIHFLPEVEVPPAGPGVTNADRVAQMTREWFTAYARGVAQFPQDWHMLQKVYTADLDPERLARARAQAEEP